MEVAGDVRPHRLIECSRRKCLPQSTSLQTRRARGWDEPRPIVGMPTTRSRDSTVVTDRSAANGGAPRMTVRDAPPPSQHTVLCSRVQRMSVRSLDIRGPH
jgi:hypothetical protein